MNSYDDFHQVIQARISVNGRLRGGDPLWQWEMMVKQFIKDISLSMKFIENEITDEELYYLSELFDEILLKTKSPKLLQTLGQRASRVRDEQCRQEILNELNDAKGVSGMF